MEKYISPSLLAVSKYLRPHTFKEKNIYFTVFEAEGPRWHGSLSLACGVAALVLSHCDPGVTAGLLVSWSENDQEVRQRVLQRGIQTCSFNTPAPEN